MKREGKSGKGISLHVFCLRDKKDEIEVGWFIVSRLKKRTGGEKVEKPADYVFCKVRYIIEVSKVRWA